MLPEPPPPRCASEIEDFLSTWHRSVEKCLLVTGRPLSGKTLAIRAAARRLGLRVETLTCGDGVDPVAAATSRSLVRSVLHLDRPLSCTSARKLAKALASPPRPVVVEMVSEPRTRLPCRVVRCYPPPRHELAAWTASLARALGLEYRGRPPESYVDALHAATAGPGAPATAEEQVLRLLATGEPVFTQDIATLLPNIMDTILYYEDSASAAPKLLLLAAAAASGRPEALRGLRLRRRPTRMVSRFWDYYTAAREQ